MKQFRQRHGIRSGCTGWYQKEHSPGNKGLRQEDYMSPEAIEKTRATRFKKGDRPPNELPVGSVVVNSYGYKLRKRRMEGALWERWEFLHKAVWEERNGPVPEGMVVTFKDSDSRYPMALASQTTWGLQGNFSFTASRSNVWNPHMLFWSPAKGLGHFSSSALCRSLGSG